MVAVNPVKPVITREQLVKHGYQSFIDVLKTNNQIEKYCGSYSTHISDEHGRKYTICFAFTESEFTSGTFEFLCAETLFNFNNKLIPVRVGANSLTLEQVENILETMFVTMSFDYNRTFSEA